MKKFSESKALSNLTISGPNLLSQEEIYRACVFSANYGSLHAAAKGLPEIFRKFLHVRILLANNEVSKAQAFMDDMKSFEPVPSEVVGDYSFLQGQIDYRQGDWRSACVNMAEAKELYGRVNDVHRSLRSAINEQISYRDISNYQSGPLRALRLEAKREGAFDLAGNIDKAEAIDRLVEGQWAEAKFAAIRAVENYDKDGCIEDAAIAACVAAMTCQLLGESEMTLKYEARIGQVMGKVTAYYQAWIAIKKGSAPQIEKTHILSSVPWEAKILKSGSVTGKILSRLNQAPATKHELITVVWGESACGPSYEGRLFNALNQIKKKLGCPIYFDGERYRFVKL